MTYSYLMKWLEISSKHARMSNFTMGTILEKGFPQGQVHTVHSTSVEVLVTTREATGNPATDFATASNREVLSSTMAKVEMANNIHLHVVVTN